MSKAMPRKKLSVESNPSVSPSVAEPVAGTTGAAAAPARARKAPARKVSASKTAPQAAAPAAEPKPAAKRTRKASERVQRDQIHAPKEAVTHHHKSAGPKAKATPTVREFDAALHQAEIEKQAYLCYLERCETGFPGTSEGDWLYAVELVKQRVLNG
jgi:hypothetical protein